MGEIRDLFKKIGDIKGTFCTRMGTINDRNGKDLTEAEEIKKRWQVYTEELYKNGFNDPDNHDVWIMEDGVRHPGIRSQVGLRKYYYK